MEVITGRFEPHLNHELLKSLIINKYTILHREVVLNCATIIEKTLKDDLISHLDKEQTGEDAKNRILKQTNGFNKTLKKLIKLELTKDLDYESISIGTIELRNRVIHGGYFPTTEETDQAIKDAKLVIQEHNVPIFRD